MTAVAPRSTPFTGPRRTMLSPLETLLQNERRDLIPTLARTVMRTRGVRLQDAEEVVGTALVTAITWERQGKGWNPDGNVSLDQYMFNRVFDALRDSRRRARRKPATPTGDASEHASDVASAPEADEDITELRKLAEKLRRHFEEETGGRIPIGIMDHHLRGVEEQKTIAMELKCTVSEVKAGWGRLKYHGERMVTAARGKKERS